MTEPVRLAKRLAEMLGCSRREAEQYIEGGWVTVDGVVVVEPQFRVTAQAIEVDKDASLLAPVSVTILLHKPAGHDADLMLATHSGEDLSGIRKLKKHFSGVELVTPLPYAASGFAYGATATTSSQLASASTGDNATTTYSVRYVANISPITPANAYTSNIVYIATANF